MNKYELTLPLVALSFFLGYFSSCLPTDQFYAITTVTAVFVAIVGFALFLKHKKVGNEK